MRKILMDDGGVMRWVEKMDPQKKIKIRFKFQDKEGKMIEEFGSFFPALKKLPFFQGHNYGLCLSKTPTHSVVA